MTWWESSFDSLAGYPRWLVLACVTVLAAAALWLLAKVLKWSLYLLAILVLVAGGGLVLALLVT